MSQLSMIYQRNAENDKDVKFIMQSLKDEKFTKERLERTLHNCKNYEAMGHKTRGNSNLMRAVQILLKQQPGA